MAQSEQSQPVVLIAGGTGGLGLAVTAAVLEAGAQAIVLTTPRTNWKAFEAEIAGRVASISDLSGVEADALALQGLRGAIRTILEGFGRIDALVNLVGGFAGGMPLSETTEETLDRQFEINFKTAFLLSQAVLPVLIDQGAGRVVHTIAGAALQGVAGLSAYGPSKAALLNLVQCLAAEAGPSGVRVNAIAPGIIDTPANRSAMPDADFAGWVKPERLGELYVMLALSPAGHDINGVAIPVAGA